MNIEDIRQLCNSNAIKWTTHILERLQEREINPSDIRRCINSGEIIEEYPNDFPHPSFLILGYTINDVAIHTVIGVGNGLLWLVTAYYPTPEKWNPDNKTRKETKI